MEINNNIKTIKYYLLHCNAIFVCVCVCVCVCVRVRARARAFNHNELYFILCLAFRISNNM